MIENEAGLREARRRLGILEEALVSLRTQLQAENPVLLPLASAGYVHQIRALRDSIQAYTGAPTEAAIDASVAA